MKYLLSQTLTQEINARTRTLVAEAIDGGIDPQLGVILVGNNESSLKYISIKSRQAKEVGIILSLYQMEEDSDFETVSQSIEFLNSDPDIQGIVLQLPLPDQFTPEQTERLIHLVAPEKDVDGLRGDWQKLTYTRYDLESFYQPAPYAIPPMISSVLGLLDSYDIDIAGKRIVLVGEGRLVGGPLKTYLQALGQEVQSVTEETDGIIAITQTADILISGTGQDNLITYQWVKEGAVVIDCAADIHLDSVEQVASALAPAKGGVGPLTVAWLLYNLAQAAHSLKEVSHV